MVLLLAMDALDPLLIAMCSCWKVCVMSAGLLSRQIMSILCFYLFCMIIISFLVSVI